MKCYNKIHICTGKLIKQYVSMKPKKDFMDILCLRLRIFAFWQVCMQNYSSTTIVMTSFELQWKDYG